MTSAVVLSAGVLRQQMLITFLLEIMGLPTGVGLCIFVRV